MECDLFPMIFAYTDPSVDGPILPFNTGKIINGVEQYNKDISTIDNFSVGWDLTQWSSPEILNPLNFDSNVRVDPIIGPELYEWETQTEDSSLGVYGSKNNYTYELTSKNGHLQDTYLQTYTPAVSDFTFDKQVTFSARERISDVYGSLGSYTQVQNDIVVVFNDSRSANYNSGLRSIVAFVQEIVSSSRGGNPAYANWDASTGSVIYNINLSSDISGQSLKWASSSGSLQNIDVNFSSAVAQMASYLASQNTDGLSPSTLENMSMWSLSGFYAGVESSQGSGASLDIQDPIITRDSFKNFAMSDVTTHPVTIGGDPLIDFPYYFAANPDVASAGLNAMAHYLEFGWKEGRNPDAFFSTVGYLAANPDVARAGTNPLLDYETTGWKQDRDPAASFDVRLYLQHNPDVVAGGMDPLQHYLNFGQYEDRATYAAIGPQSLVLPGFDRAYYELANPDVAASKMDPLLHYEVFGWKEGRMPDAFFDVKFYQAQNPDVAASGIDPLSHYDALGWKEGRAPSAAFSTNSYLEHNTDVAAAGVNPLQHYLTLGIFEGRALV